jgi:hypothetical protein
MICICLILLTSWYDIATLVAGPSRVYSPCSFLILFKYLVFCFGCQVLSRPELRRLYEGPVVPLQIYQNGVYQTVMKSMWDATQLIEFHITTVIVAENAVGLSFLFPATYFVWRNADGSYSFCSVVCVWHILFV